jgi:squalene cyclase
MRALQLHERDSEEVVRGASYLLKRQNADGGWGFYDGNPSDPACTAHAMLGLLESGSEASSEAMLGAARYLLSEQLPDGSWEISWEEDPMHHHDKWFHFTTPWAILALSKGKIRASQSRLESAIDALIRSQEETGGWRALEGYDPFTWATGNALMALGLWFTP